MHETTCSTQSSEHIDTQKPAMSVNPTEDLFSTEKWGVTPIRQDTPWELPPSPTSQQASNVASSSSSSSVTSSLQQQPTSSASTSTSSSSAAAAAAAAAAAVAASASVSATLAGALPIGTPAAASNATGLIAPGSASAIKDNDMTPKLFGMTNRSSTWSAFGTSNPNEHESEWPKANSKPGISSGNSTQPSSAFDLVPEFEPGKSWHGFAIMKSFDDNPPINNPGPGLMSPFDNPYASSSKSPPSSQYDNSSCIGTWSPIVKNARPGSKWDGDGPDNGSNDNGRFDDGTAIWGSPAQTKVTGIDWADKSGDVNSNNDKSRSMAGNNQAYRSQQSSSSTSLLMSSSNTSPSSQQNRNQPLKQPSLSRNFDQTQQQSNALLNQANQPSRGIGLPSIVPSTQQLKHMVQQIQLAVQAGHLNPHILNQPLAPVTLQLLYQLLQQIKVLQQLQMQASQPQFGKPGGAHLTNVHITKTKQNILNLQNQIAAQQAVYIKQTQAHNISSRQPTMPGLATGGVGGNVGPALPPGISQSGDSFRSGASVADFHGPTSAMVNNFGNVDSMGANGLANSIGHMNLGGNGSGGLHSTRFDQPWRAPAAKQHPTSMTSSSSPFANHNLMNSAHGGQHKSMLNNAGGNGGGSSFMQGGEFARAPGPASSLMDNNLTPKPFSMANRSSTWSAFGTSGPNEPESEWPKTTNTSTGISSGNSTQPSSNAFDLVPEFEPGKPWRGSMLMKTVEDDPTMTPASMARSMAPQRKTIWSDEIL